MYADDGLIYGDSQRGVESFIKYFKKSALAVGSDIHPKKSRWIKRDGEFEGSFKFIGLRYDPGRPHEVEGCTRNGSKYFIPLIDIGDWNFEGWESGQRFVRDYTNLPRFILWNKYRLLGTMMALMYNHGKLETPVTEESAWYLTAEKGSLLEGREHEIVRKVARNLSLDLKNISSVSLWYIMYRLKKYNGHLTKRITRLERYKPSKAKKIAKKLKTRYTNLNWEHRRRLQSKIGGRL